MNAKAASALKELHEENALGLARDHIAQAYLGQWGGVATMEKSRNRIHWITSQVRGPRILDVGTSEGIVPILLGREGFRVVGIDINAEAIEYANAMLAQEAEAVRERVQFRNVSLFQGETDLIFDTVIMGEVVEHVSNVENFVDTALRHLAEDGRLIVTTPFGVFPDRDHKHTFYLSDIRDLLAPRGRIEQLSVTDGYIRAVLRNANGKAPGEPGEDSGLTREESLLTLTEEATYASQVALWRQLNRAGQSAEKARQDLVAAQREQASFAQQLKEKTEALIRATQDLSAAREALATAEMELTEKQQSIEHQQAKLVDQEARLNAASGEILARETAVKATRAELETSKAELAAAKLELRRIKSSSAYKTGRMLKRIIKRLKAPGKLIKSAFGHK